MHKVHILVPWNRVDEWHEWMDHHCPGWISQGAQTWRRPDDVETWREFLGSIRDKVLQDGNGELRANYRIKVPTDSQLMLLKLTWEVDHIGTCMGRGCSMSTSPEGDW